MVVVVVLVQGSGGGAADAMWHVETWVGWQARGASVSAGAC